MVAHVNCIKGKGFRGRFNWKIVEFNEIQIRIEGGAVIREGGSVDDITQGNGSFMNEPFPRPDFPTSGLPGLTNPSDHNPAAPIVPRGG